MRVMDFFIAAKANMVFRRRLIFRKKYISGQTSADPFMGKAPEGGIEAEVNMCLTRISHILESAGIDKTHVVMCRIYLKDMSFWKEVNRVYGEFFGDHTPARAVYGVSQIHHGVNIEMEVVAEM